MTENDSPTRTSATADSIWLRRLLAVAPFGAILFATLIVYWPAWWYGGFIWDDDAHVTREDIHTTDGLYSIWFVPGVSAQYYPLLHTVFWLEYKLWGENTLGYHVVNVLLHALAASLVYIILRRLKVPGAFLAAALFAVHPVCVESVAWITELKNTLSGVFYLGATACYLRFDENRKSSSYAAALALFVLALMTKTVTATLPAALLVIFWWRRGRIEWKRDVMPLVPWFVLGAGMGLYTAWFEHNVTGAHGADYEMSLIQRLLLSGRVIWFYLYKLFWPAELIFIYPRWQLSAEVWWQWLFPLSTLALVMGLWLLRGRSRGPLAGVLFFIGTLFPVLGFFNVYPFMYSFVADHFQYLASLGIITLVSAGVALLLRKLNLLGRVIGYSLCVVTLVTFGALAFQQCYMYRDLTTLYTTTIEHNPGCWMAHNNLGGVYLDKGKYEDALRCYEEALRLRKVYPEAVFNLAFVQERMGRNEEASANYEAAIQQQPDLVAAHFNFGNLLLALGEIDRAAASYENAIRLSPNAAAAYYGLGNARLMRGETSPAIAAYESALKVNSALDKAHNNLGIALTQAGDLTSAIAHFREAVRLRPDNPDAVGNLGDGLIRAGEYKEAESCLREALRLNPDFAKAKFNLSLTQSALGERDAAISTAEAALALAQSQGNSNLIRLIEEHLASLRSEEPDSKRSDGLELDN